MSDDAGDIMTVRQRLYQAVRHDSEYTGPVRSADLFAMLQEFDTQAECIKRFADRLSSEDEEAGGLATQKLRVAETRLTTVEKTLEKLAACTEKLLSASAEHVDGYLEPEARADCRAALNEVYAGSIEKESEKMDSIPTEIQERLHAADVWLHMHTMVDHSCEECRVFFRATLAAQNLLKVDDHLAAARARLAPDKRREAWSASANRIMATVIASDIDIALAALTDVEKRLEAALELNRIGGSHTYHCKSGTGHGGCDDECARLRKVMLGADV